MGFSKGNLCYVKENAEDGKSFILNVHVRERVKMDDKVSM
jgi:hypothetical protein